MRLLKGLMLLILMFAISMPNIKAQENTQVTFASKWSANEVVRYSMIKSETKNEITNSSRSDISIRVLAKTDEGYILEWKFEDIIPAAKISDEQVKYMFDLTKGLAIRYTTDKHGAYQKVINQDEVKNYIKTSTEVLTQKITDGKLKNSIFSLMNNLLINDHFINLVVAKEISLLHNPYIFGSTFSDGEQYIGEVTLFNPFNSQQPLIGKVLFLATQSASSKNIEIEQELDREKSAKILTDTINKMLKDTSGKEISEEQKLKSLEFKDSFRYVFKNDENWVENCSLTRRIAVGGKERIETIEFRRK